MSHMRKDYGAAAGVAFIVGVVIIYMIMAYHVAFGADEGDLDLRRLPKTDATIAIFLTPQDNDTSMRAAIIHVPHVVSGTPLVCFKMPTKHETNCFYQNTDTGEVILKQVPSDQEDT